MVLVRVFGQLMQIVNGPGTTSQGNFALRTAPGWAGASSAEELVAAMSPAQIEALTTMASWAESRLEGETGTVTFRGQRVPRSAMMMAEEFGGRDFGGESRATLRENRKDRRISVGDISRAQGSAPTNR